jgi:hypothetical protein
MVAEQNSRRRDDRFPAALFLAKPWLTLKPATMQRDRAHVLESASTRRSERFRITTPLQSLRANQTALLTTGIGLHNGELEGEGCLSTWALSGQTFVHSPCANTR